MKICDIVAEEDDVKTLTQCALVCTQLATYCQTHLFNKVTVVLALNDGGSRMNTRLGQLRAILEQNPEIGTYTESLSINLGQCSLSGSTHPDIPSILSKLTAVVSLTLYTSISREDAAWPPAVAPEYIRGALKYMGGRVGSPIFLRDLQVSSPKLVPYVLESKRDDGQHVFDFARLRHFAVRSLTDVAVGDINVFLHRAPSLEKLTLDFCCKDLHGHRYSLIFRL